MVVVVVMVVACRSIRVKLNQCFEKDQPVGFVVTVGTVIVGHDIVVIVRSSSSTGATALIIYSAFTFASATRLSLLTTTTSLPSAAFSGKFNASITLK